jgi:monovalent cation:proton antiporter-2 (CPA2) family protein
MSFTQAFIYLLAAVISVPLAKRLGLGSVLGYLLAGVVIGPFGLRLVGSQGEDLMHVAEFGVVMMLFVIGLELRPAMLWQMRGPILGLGGAQVVCTAAVVAVIAAAVGLSWQVAVTIGFIIAMSSTAIVLQLLNEKGIMRTAGGRASFSVLLFQDIAVIPILALLPLLATFPPAAAAHATHSAIEHLAAWQAAIVVLAAVAAVIVAGRFLLRPVFRYIAATELREMFTATALLLVVGIALLMQHVGLSPALGAFLAGVVLADSEYRHQLETDIEPFKGLLLGLFFISVGAGIDFNLISGQPTTVALMVAAVLVLKFAVLLAISRYSRLEPTQRYLFAFALAQGGEFAFVLCSFAVQNGVLPPDISNLLVASVALTMAAAPVLFTINDRLVQPRFASVLPEREPDDIDERDNPVIVAGVGRFGHIVARLLRLNGFGTTVLDHDAEQVETLGRFGIKSYYGDATRLDLLRTAGAGRAKLFVIAIDHEEQALRIVDLVHEHFPKLRILARATSRQHAYELLRRGVHDVYRETFGSAVDLSVDALQALGMPQQRALRAAQIFREHDNASVREMAQIDSDDMKRYVSLARLHIANLENALAADRELAAEAGDPTSHPEAVRAAESKAELNA